MASDAEEDAGSASRPRWSGDVADLAKALDMRQPGDVKYDEDKKKPKLNIKLIGQNMQRLRKVRKLMDTMAFRSQDIESAVALIYEKHKAEWNLTPQAATDFKTMVPMRIKKMIQHRGRALRPNDPPILGA